MNVIEASTFSCCFCCCVCVCVCLIPQNWKEGGSFCRYSMPGNKWNRNGRHSILGL